MTMTITHRNHLFAILISALLAFSLLAGMGSQAFADYGYGPCGSWTYYEHYGPSIDDMWGCDERVTIPRDNSWLSDYEYKYVQSEYGTCIVLRCYPVQKFEYDGYNFLGRVYEGDWVVELARQNGFSLIQTSTGQVGWVKSNLIVYNYNCR